MTKNSYGLLNRRLPSFVLAFVLLPCAMAQSARDYGLYEMVRINDSTFIDCKEVSVADMMAFAMENPSMAMPDPAVVRELPYGPLFYGPRSGSLRMVKGWKRDYRPITTTVPSDSVANKAQRFRARLLMGYPIAGLTYDQAMAYCAWRTGQERAYQRVGGK